MRWWIMSLWKEVIMNSSNMELHEETDWKWAFGEETNMKIGRI
jgi:hypothetical protein